jgi:hypothetical protein
MSDRNSQAYYRALLKFYPRHYRDEYEPEILDILTAHTGRDSKLALAYRSIDLLKSAEIIRMRRFMSGWKRGLSLFASAAPLLMLSPAAVVLFAVILRFHSDLLGGGTDAVPVLVARLFIARCLAAAAIAVIALAIAVMVGNRVAAIIISGSALAFTVAFQVTGNFGLWEVFCTSFFALELAAVAACPARDIRALSLKQWQFLATILAGALPATLWVFGSTTTANVGHILRDAVIVALFLIAAYLISVSAAIRRATLLFAVLLIPVIFSDLLFPEQALILRGHIAIIVISTYMLPTTACILILAIELRTRWMPGSRSPVASEG